MNPIVENIMALAFEFAAASTNFMNDPTNETHKAVTEAEQALRAAIEQALGQGEPVAYTSAYELHRLHEAANGLLYSLPVSPAAGEVPLFTAPQPQPKQEPVAWLRKNGFRFMGEIEPQDDSEVPLYTTPQPQPCNIAEDGVCEALECPRADDTALLRRALGALTAVGLSAHKTKQVRNEAIAALRQRLELSGDR